LSGVSTIETDQRFSGREDFWIIVAARSEDETEIRAGKAGGRRDQGTVRNLVCGAIVTPMEGAYGNQKGHPGRFAGGA
jgi:hypothetical protein